MTQRPGLPPRIAIGVFAAVVVVLSTVDGWSDSATAVADTNPPKDVGAAAAAVVRPFLAGDAGLYRDRLAYRRAAYAARTGRRAEFDTELAKLDGYPLRPYLLYFDARRRLSRIGEDRASELRAELAGTPLEERFLREWLVTQAEHGRWATYAKHYEPSDDVVGRCHYARALYRTGNRSQALARVRDLWVVPQSQPEECDPVFNSWIGAGGLDQETVWTRLLLALEANETRLARYLLRFFDRTNANAGRLCYDVHLKPETVRSLSRFADTPSGRRALRHGLVRYAKREPNRALELWDTVESTYAFDETERDAIREHLTVVVAGMGLVPRDGPIGYNAADRQQVAKGLVLNRRWAEATLWITSLPPKVATEPEWRYWLGRALIDSGEEPSTGQQHLRAIAGLPTWYGLLAAADLGSPPGVPEDPSRHDPRAWHELLVVPAVRRMVELLAADDLVNARREWQYALPKLEPHQRLDLVELTAALGWVDQAIAGAWDADLKEVTRIRYPTPHLDAFRHGAFSANLPMSLLLAISRRESAFNPRARSPAGARGLMQLMPATARSVADRIRDRRPSTEDLLRPDTSVRLGAHHLAGLMSRYDGHRVLAIAAYNAGESRIDRWRRDASGMPTAVWVERIPFRETRAYVKNVLVAATIYGQRTGTPGPMLGPKERVIP
ncbi:MAG: lytic transglycosylase domain-containing protein [Gammaproteobacteria bacterium]|nr:lytic transglycosylase domain-containing protein [Gammaproteobacteria bacterium]